MASDLVERAQRGDHEAFEPSRPPHTTACTRLPAAFSVTGTDGSFLVYHYLGGGGDIARVDLDGRVTVIAADDDASEFDPIISPDGSLIAFVEEDGESLAVVNADGTGRRTLGPNPFGCQRTAVWSPDGSTIVGFLESRACNGLGAIRLDDPTTVIELDAPATTVGFPSWQRLAP